MPNLHTEVFSSASLTFICNSKLNIKTALFTKTDVSVRLHMLKLKLRKKSISLEGENGFRIQI